MEPTKEQIKWFWEQCGIGTDRYQDGVWLERIGEGRYLAHPIDLNNLFKYAVPKDKALMLSRFPTRDFWTAKIGATIQARDKDPALVLFWAIYKALGGE